MIFLKTIFHFRLIQKCLKKHSRIKPNLRGAVRYPPGHFYSPLMDIEDFERNSSNPFFDGAEWWEHIDLRPNEQRSYYEDLLNRFPMPNFPSQKTDGCRYFTKNRFFPFADAFTLSGIIRKEKPNKIVEVGSGFSSAVILDTLEHNRMPVALTFIEPFPDRLNSLLSPDERSALTILSNRVQDVPLSVFDQLEERDLLFIDSSHVAKIGSDVSFIFLRILPRLKRGVLVHFHDIFYPFSYPAKWIREGRAWNETLFLRTFLIGNRQFELVAFNSYAAQKFPEIFKERLPVFLTNPGGSIWIRKVG